LAKKSSVGRRNFLKGAGAAAGLAIAPQIATAQNTAVPDPPKSTADVTTPVKPGADFMVDVIRSLGMEYCAANPGSSFRGIHESILNYAGNRMPELLTCLHEESSAAMAHGYAKIEGKPMMIMVHGTVGRQHASMAIYNAYCDRVPIYIVAGNILDVSYRRGNAEWVHSVQDCAAMVRDFVKWDDNPVSLGHFAESAVRAYNIAMTPPYEPVLIVADGELQEEPIENKNLRVPKLVMNAPPQGDAGAVREAARLLVAADNPVIVAGRMARSQHGMELLQARVQDQRLRMNFPTAHPLYGNPGVLPMNPNVTDADVLLALEAQDVWGITHKMTPLNRFGMESQSIMKPGAKVIVISAVDLNHKSNYQDFGRYVEADLAITGDAEATLPALIEEVRRASTADRRIAIQDRGRKVVEANNESRRRHKEMATVGWDASPVSTARLAAEIWAELKNEDWSLVSWDRMMSAWPTRLWNFSKHYQFIGTHGGSGIGYGLPAAVGSALANRKHGRLTVNIQTDGDLCYAPGVLWTAAHHQIPILNIMHNNRAYHEERMYLPLLAAKYDRSPETSDIGTALKGPNIDYASVAKGFGLYAEGPIENPNELGPAIRRGIERVKKGEPVLIDVVTQPR
jgi:acetolactate synthase-1/2/3 large subunit